MIPDTPGADKAIEMWKAEELRQSIERETIEMNKSVHDALQVGLKEDQICIREGIVIAVGTEAYPKFGFEFFCWRSPEMTQEMSMFVKYAKSKNCLLDVGAFHGIFSSVFTSMNDTATAYAFEPFEEPFAILRRAASMNNKRGFPVKAALSDKSGQIEMFSFSGHLEKNKRTEDQQPLLVSSVTGDSFCFSCWPNLYPDVIKIDCEAGELDVLRGLFNVISKYHPLIFLELHYEQLKLSEIIEIMKLIGYWEYKIIDTQTDTEITLSDLQNQTGEKRIILI